MNKKKASPPKTNRKIGRKIKNNSSLSFLKKEILEFESFLKNYFNERFKKTPPSFKKALKYTLFLPCKRFRPALVISVCRALGQNDKKGFPLAGAIELAHTASLIHDDLPSMDDDDFRREHPSHHKVFGEGAAVLSGSALFIEALYLLIQKNQNKNMIKKITDAISLMMRGQALDLALGLNLQKNKKLSRLSQMHQMKTGALIQASVEGCFTLSPQKKQSQKQALKKSAFYLGEAFQLADDLEDRHSGDSSNILGALSPQKTLKLLEKKTSMSLKALEGFGREAQTLRLLIEFNQNRGVFS